jgi:integrase
MPSDAREEWEFAALTGLRQTEIKRARFEWVRDGALNVPASGAKTRRMRRIALSASAHSIIEHRRALDHDGFIFDRAYHWLAVKRACKSNGLPLVTLRDLRHWYCSQGLAGTGDIAAVVRQAGHSVEVAERYQSTTAPRDMAVADAAAEALDRITGPDQQNAKTRKGAKILVGAPGFEPATSSSQSLV